jgi:large subunit ribosomal protein L4
MTVEALSAEVSKVNFDGASAGTATLDVKVAKPDVAKGLVHKYVVMVRQNARRGTASTLTKSEVRGGGRKPFKQKGTGNARAGSTRTPLKPGGGVIFGPKPKDWSIKMNKKERRLAMATALQSAASAMIVIDDISGNISKPSANDFNKSLQKWGVGATEKAYVITKDANPNVTLSTRNISRVVHTDITHLNVYDVLNADKVVVDAAALAHIQSFFGENGQAWE